jgi:hypothetical protein
VQCRTAVNLTLIAAGALAAAGGAAATPGASTGPSSSESPYGNLAFENSVANPATGDKTVVAMTDDTSTIPPSTVFGGQLYIHHGMKRSTGNPAEKAGLTGGTLYGHQGRWDVE